MDTAGDKASTKLWANRAASAEAAVTTRHMARVWRLPFTQLGIVAWPPSPKDLQMQTWHYWWQAHLLDCLVDAQLREPEPERLKRVRAQLRGHRLKNSLRWTNDYYDDMAWLALSIERADRLLGVRRARALKTLTKQFTDAWMPEYGGGIPWRKQDRFFNAPANGPAGIFLARHHELRLAQMVADWIDETLIDPETNLVFDGIKYEGGANSSDGTAGSMVRAQYTYCQGVVLGLETELAVRTSDDRHRQRARRLVAAVDKHMAPGGVLKGVGGGDGGLFHGITARYLALVASALPGDSDEDRAARDTARRIVMTSAQSAWDYRQTVEGLPLFGHDWSRAAAMPRAEGRAAEFVEGAVNESEIPERDLSVQLSGWMLIEAASTLSV